jgi:hypothetical protein
MTSQELSNPVVRTLVAAIIQVNMLVRPPRSCGISETAGKWLTGGTRMPRLS